MSEILEKYEGKKLILCLPGNSYSGDFLKNIIRFNNELVKSGIDVYLSNYYSSEVYRVRDIVAGGDASRGRYQAPFGTQIDSYDYLMWIDSDIIFNLKNFEDLIEMDKEVACGWYMQPDNTVSLGFIEQIEAETKIKKAKEIYDTKYIYRFRKDNEISERTEPYKIGWAGMGWMLMKQGVMEKIEYPWFAPKVVRNTEELNVVCGEDVSFALKLKDAKIDIWAHPLVRVGHEKVRVI